MKTRVWSLVFTDSKVKNDDIKIGAAAQKSQIIIFIQKSLIMQMLSLFSSAVKDQDYGCFLLFWKGNFRKFSLPTFFILNKLYLSSYSSVDNFPISKADLEYFVVFLLLKHQFQALLPCQREGGEWQYKQCLRQFTFPNRQRWRLGLRQRIRWESCWNHCLRWSLPSPHPRPPENMGYHYILIIPVSHQLVKLLSLYKL